jgi:hypothetical protein
MHQSVDFSVKKIRLKLHARALIRYVKVEDRRGQRGWSKGGLGR